jgi:hypothetical protein
MIFRPERRDFVQVEIPKTKDRLHNKQRFVYTRRKERSSFRSAR